jgi:hypothetical protein
LIGRFLSNDPDRDGMNWYIYIDPVNAIDPKGTSVQKPTGPPDAYCKAAGSDPTADGMVRANRCFCEVSKMVHELIDGSSFRGALVFIFCGGVRVRIGSNAWISAYTKTGRNGGIGREMLCGRLLP